MKKRAMSRHGHLSSKQLRDCEVNDQPDFYYCHPPADDPPNRNTITSG